MSEQEMKNRIAELEEAVRTLIELWTKEREHHDRTQERLINISKMVIGIKE